LGLPFAGPTVVVTHHAPHPTSLPTDDLAHCYASDMSHLMQDRQPDLWVHGHIHSRADYGGAADGARVEAEVSLPTALEAALESI